MEIEDNRMENSNIYNEEGLEVLMACESSEWGGRWTEKKLDAFENYVNA